MRYIWKVINIISSIVFWVIISFWLIAEPSPERVAKVTMLIGVFVWLHFLKKARKRNKEETQKEAGR